MLSLTPGTPGSGIGLAARPKRTGSLALFYRKMYQLAYIRIRDLCERLELDTDFVQKYVMEILCVIMANNRNCLALAEDVNFSPTVLWGNTVRIGQKLHSIVCLSATR